MTPNTGGFDADVISDAVSALFDKVGNGILVTHSQGGGPGWFTAIKNDGVKAVVAYEPYSSFLFPEGELPEPIKSSRSDEHTSELQSLMRTSYAVFCLKK